uniref:Uncharacterized protein n=2 Tax=Panagrolaimus sp. JU765 TaxID=591449 RepID=A0AC34QTU0_9BILA
MSKRTYDLNRILIRSLVFQILVPIFSIVVPFSAGITIVWLKFSKTEAINPWIFQIGTTHAILNSFTMMAVI